MGGSGSSTSPASGSTCDCNFCRSRSADAGSSSAAIALGIAPLAPSILIRWSAISPNIMMDSVAGRISGKASKRSGRSVKTAFEEVFKAMVRSSPVWLQKVTPTASTRRRLRRCASGASSWRARCAVKRAQMRCVKLAWPSQWKLAVLKCGVQVTVRGRIGGETRWQENCAFATDAGCPGPDHCAGRGCDCQTLLQLSSAQPELPL